MAETKIEWADFTFNPWTGCTKVSPGCDHCYAEGWAKRSGHVEWGAHGARRCTTAANWRLPLKWNAASKDNVLRGLPRPRVFCASLADVFDNHDSILPTWRSALWDLILETPNLDWLLLTKRPQNITRFLPASWGAGWHNVWLGTTAENQEEANRRIPHLLAVPAAVRFLSIEPLLGPVDLTELRRSVGTGVHEYSSLDCDVDPDDDEWRGATINWVIVGGESGPGARPMHPDWARSLRDQCQAAGVAFFFKQRGEWTWLERPADGFWPTEAQTEGFVRVQTDGTLSGLGWPMQRVGKKASGRLLDGRTWDEVPA